MSTRDVIEDRLPAGLPIDFQHRGGRLVVVWDPRQISCRDAVALLQRVIKEAGR